MLPTRNYPVRRHDLQPLRQVRQRRGPAGRRASRASTSISTAAASPSRARASRTRGRQGRRRGGLHAGLMSAGRALAALRALLVAIFALAAARRRRDRSRHQRHDGHTGHDRRAATPTRRGRTPARTRRGGRAASVADRDDLTRRPPRAAVAFASSRAAARPLRDFDVEHKRRMHLIVVRRDLRRFQHLHPRRPPTGPGRRR